MSKAANLKVNVTSESRQAQDALGKIHGQLDGISKLPSATGFVAGLGVWTNAIGTVARAVGKAVDISKEWVNLYTTQQQAELRLQGTLRATGNQIGMNAAELGNMASQFQAVTRFGDEMILPMQQAFIATQKLTKEQLPEVIELSLDMAEAMGIDGANAAKVMARALADPVSGLESLKEKNIFFTQSEKDKIKELVTSNRLSEAQRIILDKVASAYGGIARAVADTDIGKMTQINNIMGDIKEGLGEMIVGSIEPAFDFIQNELERIQKWLDTANKRADQRKADASDAVNFQNGNLESVSSDFLTRKIEELQNTLNNSEADPAKGVWASYYDQLDKAIAEMQRRYYLPKAATATPIPATRTGDGDAEAGATEKQLTLYEEILAATSATEAAQKKVLQDRIIENEHIRDHLSLQVSTKKMTEEEARAAKDLLDQQIALDREKLRGFEPVLPTASDFIKDNLALSISAQEASIDAEIATAEARLASVKAGSDEAMQINEIIASLKEQKSLLTEEEDIFENILSVTGSTEAAQKRSLQNNILKNIALRDQLATQVLLGKLTREQADVAAEALTQQIELDKKTIEGFDKNPEKELVLPESTPTASEYIASNRSLSQSAQLDAIDINLALTEGYLALAEAGSKEEAQLWEIITALQKQRELILSTPSTPKPDSRSYEVATAMVSTYAQTVSSMYGLVSQVYDNQINALESTLDKQRKAWDDYYADIQDKYKKDRDSLDAQYQWGRISAEEYFASLTALSDAKRTAEEENASSEEEMMKRIDELKERQFNADKANSIIQATVAGALSIANIWKEWGKQPIMAGILTGLSAAAVGAQIATIASQQYTPMAEGGVATGPTHALIGEGGEPELVLPLSKANEFGFGGSGGVINIIVNAGNGMYSRDEWVKIVFDAIERAQKTGALPRWRYAA